MNQLTAVMFVACLAFCAGQQNVAADLQTVLQALGGNLNPDQLQAFLNLVANSGGESGEMMAQTTGASAGQQQNPASSLQTLFQALGINSQQQALFNALLANSGGASGENEPMMAQTTGAPAGQTASSNTNQQTASGEEEEGDQMAAGQSTNGNTNQQAASGEEEEGNQMAALNSLLGGNIAAQNMIMADD